jgi:hypothetical protein
LGLLSEKPQLPGFGTWVTVNAWPLTVIVPTRAAIRRYGVIDHAGAGAACL